jgi:hypothetical protein
LFRREKLNPPHAARKRTPKQDATNKQETKKEQVLLYGVLQFFGFRFVGGDLCLSKISLLNNIIFRILLNNIIIRIFNGSLLYSIII